MSSHDSQEILIQGITGAGRTFRPTNWAERLAGVMSQYRPQAANLGDHLHYSPWCYPVMRDKVNSVVVNRAMQQQYPEAWAYIENFARDNDLQVTEHVVALEPEPAPDAVACSLDAETCPVWC